MMIMTWLSRKIKISVTDLQEIIMVIGVLDYGYQKWQTTQDLKMTKQEVKDEFKQTEGDPQIKGKIRQKQRQMAMSRIRFCRPLLSRSRGGRCRGGRTCRSS